MKICEQCSCDFDGGKRERFCKECKRKRYNQRKVKQRQRKKKAVQTSKHCLDDTLAELQAYNEENNTNLSYGEFMSMKSYRKAK